jgi:molybdopterin converting factor small subunit
MKVCVKLFAVAKQLADRDEVAIDVVEPATIADVERALLATVPALAAIASHARWAVDAKFAVSDHAVTERSEVALIPPVSGG